jgi:hypothetical protein
MIEPTSRVTVLLSILLLSFPVASRVAGKDNYRPVVDAATFKSTIDNPYYPLDPGTTYQYMEKAGKNTAEIETTVTRDHKVIMGVTCVVVHTIVREKGEIDEETNAWYAQDRQGNVWYFGEDAKEFHSGGRVSTEGSWEAGVGENQPGIVMPGDLGMQGAAPYRQSYSPGAEEDMGRIEEKGTMKVLGSLKAFVRTKEWSNLSAGSEKKWYAEGIGLFKEISAEGDVTELISVTQPKP